MTESVSPPHLLSLLSLNQGRPVHINGYKEWTLDSANLIQQSPGHFDAVEYAGQIAEGAV